MTALDRLVEERRVVICAGPGGVGKTTCAAASSRTSASPSSVVNRNGSGSCGNGSSEARRAICSSCWA